MWMGKKATLSEHEHVWMKKREAWRDAFSTSTYPAWNFLKGGRITTRSPTTQCRPIFTPAKSPRTMHSGNMIVLRRSYWHFVIVITFDWSISDRATNRTYSALQNDVRDAAHERILAHLVSACLETKRETSPSEWVSVRFRSANTLH